MKVVGYSYPWDYVGDPHAAPRAAAWGVDVVAVAAAYHASRVVGPLHPTRRVMEVPQSAIYVPVREEAWRGHRLVPSCPTWTKDENLFAGAQRQLMDAGVEVNAWLVLTHHDDLGRSNSDLVVQNAYGDSYSYALCPQAPDVREYCLTLVEEILRSSDCPGVVVEACGPMGLEHAGPHDKSEFAQWSFTSKQLLSICFCHHCQRGLEESGLDVDELARRVREGVDRAALSIEEALGDELSERVATFRIAIAAELRRAIVKKIREVRPGATITLHASANQWATGPFSALCAADSLEGVSAVVANCWDPSTGEYELQTLHALVEDRVRVGAYLRLDQGWFGESLVEDTIGRYVRAGMTELHLYHLGLLSRAGLEAVTRVVRASAKYTVGHWMRRRTTGSIEELPL